MLCRAQFCVRMTKGKGRGTAQRTRAESCTHPEAAGLCITCPCPAGPAGLWAPMCVCVWVCLDNVHEHAHL